MIKNKTFINFIMVTLMVSFLTISVGKVSPALAMAVGPLADPVYDTEIIALYDYVTQNVEAPQLDIFFFLTGALAVAQMGAQDAKLISPYDSEENIQQWLINCGIQLYNSVIGLVPEGDYYVGLPIAGQNGNVPGVRRETIKALVAQMMGNAVAARNYPDLGTMLEENPDQILLPFNRDLQLGVNAVFGLNGGAYEWQQEQRDWSNGNFVWRPSIATGTVVNDYNVAVSHVPLPRLLGNANNMQGSDYRFTGIVFNYDQKYDLFINTNNHTVSFHNAPERSGYFYLVCYDKAFNRVDDNRYPGYIIFTSESYNPANYNDYKEVAIDFLNFVPSVYGIEPKLVHLYGNFGNGYVANFDFVNRVMAGPTWESAVEVINLTDLNFDLDNVQYYQQVTNDYLLDIRGLIEDLVGVTDIFNEIKNNLFDLTGIIELNPKFINVSIDLPDLSLLVDPPIPVNLNDIAELTDNSYLERVKEHAKNFGDIFVQYFAFWHNVDADIVYTMFGATILVLVGAFIGKWGHS